MEYLMLRALFSSGHKPKQEVDTARDAALGTGHRTRGAVKLESWNSGNRLIRLRSLLSHKTPGNTSIVFSRARTRGGAG